MRRGSNRKAYAMGPLSGGRQRHDGRKNVLLALGVVLALGLALAVARPGRSTSAPDSDVPKTAGFVIGKVDAGDDSPAARVIATSEQIVREGVEVAFTIEPARSNVGKGDGREDESAALIFTLTDKETGQPLAPQSRPAVWIDLQKAAQGETSNNSLTCEEKVKRYAQGSVGFRPAIDLNSYFVLTLNDDASISVIDPLKGVSGISQLYAMVVLKKRGEDWALSSDEKRLFVTMPDAGQVAVVDTDSFKVLKNIDVGRHPTRIALQPEGRYLWVDHDAGVSVIDSGALSDEPKVLAEIRTGAGPHEIAFSAEASDARRHDGADHASHGNGDYGNLLSAASHHVYVTNRAEGRVSIIDTQSLKKIRDFKVGGLPSALDVSSVNNALYVAGETNGTITVIDGKKHEIVGRINATPGIRALRFAPGGRWGFLVNQQRNLVEVFDAATNRIVHSIEVKGEPDQISFTDAYAYVRGTTTAELSLIDLSRLDQSDPLAVVRIVAGRRAPREATSESQASAVFPMHGSHVLIANAADSYIYYYMEGMNAPMGGFQSYSRMPRAVRIVDRSIRETAPGTYDAKIRLAKGGQYQAAFLLDSPRIVNCFSFRAESISSATEEVHRGLVKLEFLSEQREARAGESLALRFRIVDTLKNEPVSEVNDVQIMATLASGLWSQRYRAVSFGDGVYEANLTLPRPGAYNVLFAIPSLKVSLNQWPSLTLNATAGAASDRR